MSLQKGNFDPFEDFRREKKMRALHRELKERMESRQGQILRIIEDEERSEVLERQIKREMMDFFQESTKLAAVVLAEVADSKAKEISAQIAKEMREFFREVMARAEVTVRNIHLFQDKGENQEVETHLDRETIEEFGGRGERMGDSEEKPENPSESDDFLSSEEAVNDEENTVETYLASIGNDETKLKEAITALYRTGVITKDEARALFVKFREATVKTS